MVNEAVLAARKLIKRCNLDNAIPIDYSKLFELFRAEKMYRDTGLNICGYVHKIDNQMYDIDYLVVINQDMIEARQRFTECHELGHIALNHLFKVERLLDNNLQEYDYHFSEAYKVEMEANMFAAELLMPADIVKYCYFSEKIQNIYELSNLFNVSYQAMEYRVKNVIGRIG